MTPVRKPPITHLSLYRSPPIAGRQSFIYDDLLICQTVKSKPEPISANENAHAISCPKARSDAHEAMIAASTRPKPISSSTPAIQLRFKGLFVAAPILGWVSAGARQFRPGMIGSVGIQPLFQRSRGQPQSLSPRRHLHGFEIQTDNRLRT
jgi:hypothetical protein